MNILVIDGQGGGIGKAIIEQLKTTFPDALITAAGTNALATSAMMKSGANYAATGDNAIIYNCQFADIIIGPVGIIFANAMLGEVSCAIANAVACSKAKKILIPTNRCNINILGIEHKPLAKYIEEAVDEVKILLKS
jgi:hypothetical protein